MENTAHKWEWSEEAGYWIPANVESHHNGSSLRERLLSKGLIREKTPEEIHRDEEWAVRQVEHKKELHALRKRVDALTGKTKGDEGYERSSETTKARPDLVRERPLHSPRPPRYAVRT